MKRQLLFADEARDGVLRGATRLANAVRVTLGPKSKCVLIDERWGEPIVCNDGLTILAHALTVPTRQIAMNSGADAAAVVQRMRAGAGNQGFDAAHGTWVDLVQEGIIDATKVFGLALENAVSVASVLLLTEATLAEVPEPKAASAPEG